jgi:hypothetical protein
MNVAMGQSKQKRKTGLCEEIFRSSPRRRGSRIIERNWIPAAAGMNGAWINPSGPNSEAQGRGFRAEGVWDAA